MVKIFDKVNQLLGSDNQNLFTKENHILALDIGTEYVKALIGKVAKNGDIEIIGTGRYHQELSDMQAGAIADISGVVENCNRALVEAENQAGVSVRTAVIGIAGELVKGMTHTIKIRRKNSQFEIEDTEMARIVEMAQERAEEKVKAQLKVELGGKEIDTRMVNSALVSIYIDGYQVNNPIGFTGREVVVQLYTAFAPMIHIAALERVATLLDLDLLAVAAEPFAVSRSVIGDDINSSISAVLMDVGGGTTDIAVINEGGVQGTKMFGIGGRAFTKSIQRELGIKFAEAEEIKLTLSTETNSDDEKKASEALDRTCDVWLSGVELALSEFTEVEHLPHKILLCGGGASLEKLLLSIEQTNWYGSLPFTKRPSVAYITPSQVDGMVDATGQITDHTYITAMGLLRVGVDTLEQEVGDSAGNPIKSKIDRVLRT
ncbi:MAG: cell division FtsA domain-containing protein [Patescibacteria group bacterium]